MKTSLISLMKAVVLILLFSVISLNSTHVKAQCGFSLGILDSSQTLTFTTSPGVMDTEKVMITNVSAVKIDVSLFINSNASGQFRVLDSSKSLAAGASSIFSVRFQPSPTATGTIMGRMYFKNQTVVCRDTITLVGIIKPNLCLETIHALSYKDPVLIGSNANHEFHLINQSGADITISDISLDDSVNSGLRITSQLPIVVPPHSSSQTLTYSFSPLSDFGGNFFSTTFATLNLLGDSVGCKSVSLLLIGNVAIPGGGTGIDTNLRPLFPTDARTLALTGTGQTTSEKFIFTNNLNFVVTVNKIYMKDGTYFRISSTDPAPVPFTLSPDQTMTITISDSSLSSNIHTDSLIIAASHNLLNGSIFPIQSVRSAPSVVTNEIPQDVAISVLPNPAPNYVMVKMSGIRNADVNIFDALGKQITSARSNSFWKWDASNISDGTYIARISGESLNGEHFVISKRVIISK